MNRLTSLIMCSLVVCACSLCASAQEKKLDYRQEKDFKDAVYYIDQVEGNLDQMEAKANGWKVGDASVQIQDVDGQLRGVLPQLKQYLTNAANRFKNLPAGHSKVAPEQARYDKCVTRAAAVEKHLTDVMNGLKGVVSQGSGAGYKADFDRLKEINQMYGDPTVLQSHPERAIEIAKQIDAVKAERKRIAEKYADLLKQTTPEAKDMNDVLRYFDQQFGKFDDAAKKYAADAPREIQEDLDRAIKMGNQGVADKNHMFFRDTGGVAQRLSHAQTRYEVLAALQPNSPDTAAAKQKIDAARAEVAKMKASLNDSIIEGNRVPEERYSGGDKAELIKLLQAKWATSGVPGEVLKTGMNSAGWTRDTRWEWQSSAWYKVDRSRTQGFVVVKSSDTLASIYYINFDKDHLKEDRIETHFFDDLKSELDVNRKMLLKNVQ